ncbi:MAG: hypothetical protein ACI8WB_004849 [Phenylobacterium sp.]|jgi:hypothetical protein
MKTEKILTLGLLCCSFNLFAAIMAEPKSETFYISPAGDDSNDGKSTRSPMKTWDKVFDKMDDGDNLMAMSGIWTDDPSYDCSQSAIQPCYNGLGARLDISCVGLRYHLQDISVSAVTSRASMIRANGTAALRLHTCDGWQVDGLTLQSKDQSLARAATGNSVVTIIQSDSVELKNLLVLQNNSLYDTDLVTFSASNNGLLEGSELYDFSNSGISVVNGSSGITTRGNYLHSRWYKVGGYDKDANGNEIIPEDKECIDFHQTNGNTSENDIVVGCQGIRSSGSKNQILGSIVIDGDYAFRAAPDCGTTGEPGCDVATNYPHSNVMQDVLAVRPLVSGIECDASECFVKHATVVDAQDAGYLVKDSNSQTGFVTDADITRALVVSTIALAQNHSVGFELDGLSTLTTTDVFAYFNDNNTDYLQGQFNYKGFGGSNHSGSKHQLDPQVTCLLNLDEANSPVIDITSGQVGADLRFKYINGVKTTEKLFLANGNFAYCGAVIDGINGGSQTLYRYSCAGVKESLGTGVNGACTSQGM